MIKSNNNTELEDLFSGYSPTYSDDFTNRVIKRIENDSSKGVHTDNEFYNIFRWIALSGIAAIIFLIFTVYITEGSFTADAFYGIINYTPDEPIIASLNY